MQQQYPPLSDRIQSTFIDMIVIILIMFAFTDILEELGDTPEWVNILLFVTLLFAYEPLCTAFGCTLGNYLKRIRVRQENDTSKRINIVQAIIRYCVKVMLGWISFVTINSNSKRRAIHDMLSGSVMLKL